MGVRVPPWAPFHNSANTGQPWTKLFSLRQLRRFPQADLASRFGEIIPILDPFFCFGTVLRTYYARQNGGHFSIPANNGRPSSFSGPLPTSFLAVFARIGLL